AHSYAVARRRRCRRRSRFSAQVGRRSRLMPLFTLSLSGLKKASLNDRKRRRSGLLAETQGDEVTGHCTPPYSSTSKHTVPHTTTVRFATLRVTQPRPPDNPESRAD